MATFKHFFNSGTIGSGTIKFRHFSQTEPLPQLATPQNVTVDGTTLSWDAVANATSYDIYADGTLIGNTTGQPAAYTDCLTFTGETSEFTLKATSKAWNGTLQWSTDHNTWTALTGTEAMQSVGKKLYLRGKGNTTLGNGSGVQWQLSAKAGCSGNIQTLLDWENPPTSMLEDYSYYGMFNGCSLLTTAPELPVTTLKQFCYKYMFRNCTSLTTAPNLPATTLAPSCYESMFTGCTLLIEPPELPATTLAAACYMSMFQGCTSLTSAPVLPATLAANSCYTFMFKNCTSLKISDTAGTKIFTCPSNAYPAAVQNMFANTGGTFTGTPTAGNTYYWTK